MNAHVWALGQGGASACGTPNAASTAWGGVGSGAISGSGAAVGAGAADAPLRQKRVVMDSRDRDQRFHPTPAQYEVRLEDDLDDVVSVQLLVADVPFSSFMVGAHSRDVPVSFQRSGSGGVQVEGVAQLDVGDYVSSSDMASVLGAALNQMASSLDQFMVEVVGRTDSLLIRGRTPFTLRFADSPKGTAARLLGFAPQLDYPSVIDATPFAADHIHVVRAPFRRDTRPSRYIVLNLTAPGAEVLQSNNNSTNRAFALLPMRQPEPSIQSDYPFIKRWDPPLSRVARLGVEFTDYDGVPYDFQNQDHHIELLFTCVQQRKYT
jgi:hypothetical protein